MCSAILLYTRNSAGVSLGNGFSSVDGHGDADAGSVDSELFEAIVARYTNARIVSRVRSCKNRLIRAGRALEVKSVDRARRKMPND